MIPAYHTESKMLPATQGRMAFWRLQRNSINQSWIIVRRSRAIHQLGYGPLPQCSDPVAIGGEADIPEGAQSVLIDPERHFTTVNCRFATRATIRGASVP